MSRREFCGWMLASVVAIVAGSEVWRLFRRLVERGEASVYVTSHTPGSLANLFRTGELVTFPGVAPRGAVSGAVGRITAIDQLRGTMTVDWAHA